MHLAESVSVVIASVFPLAVADGVVGVAALEKTFVDVVFISINHAPNGNRRPNQWFDRGLLNIGQHPNHDLACSLQHPENRWFFLFQCSASTVAL